MVQMVDYFLYHCLEVQLLNMNYTGAKVCGIEGGLFQLQTFFVYHLSWTQGLWYRWWTILIYIALYSSLPRPKVCGTDGGLFSVPLSSGSVAKI